MTALLCSILLLVLFGVIVAWVRARRSVDVAIGHDPVNAAWAHRRYLRNEFEARYGNSRRRMG